MIVVTRLNGSRFAVNPDLIERVQASPDTTVVMVDGARFVVTDTIDELLEKVISFRAQVLARAASWVDPDTEDSPARDATEADAADRGAR